MKKITKMMCMLALLAGAGSTQAALVNFEIIGDVLAGNEFGDANIFNLSAGDTITATGMFDDSVLSEGSGAVSFSGTGNTLTIDVNGTLFDQDMDISGAGASLSFTGGLLSDFDYMTSDFNSLGPYFDDFGLLFGQWRADVTLTSVPVPAAAWLFGSGLLGLVAAGRRRNR